MTKFTGERHCGKGTCPIKLKPRHTNKGGKGRVRATSKVKDTKSPTHTSQSSLAHKKCTVCMDARRSHQTQNNRPTRGQLIALNASVKEVSSERISSCDPSVTPQQRAALRAAATSAASPLWSSATYDDIGGYDHRFKFVYDINVKPETETCEYQRRKQR